MRVRFFREENMKNRARETVFSRWSCCFLYLSWQLSRRGHENMAGTHSDYKTTKRKSRTGEMFKLRKRAVLCVCVEQHIDFGPKWIMDFCRVRRGKTFISTAAEQSTRRSRKNNTTLGKPDRYFFESARESRWVFVPYYQIIKYRSLKNAYAQYGNLFSRERAHEGLGELVGRTRFDV